MTTAKLWRAAALGIALAAGFSGAATAQDIGKHQFNVVGTWGFLTNWQKLEQPFWNEVLKNESKGQITASAKAQTEVNLKGTEILRLLKQGVFDFAAALPIYVDEGGAVIEAVDIAGVSRSFEMSKAIADTWVPEMQKVMEQRHGAMILATFPFPEQVFFCKGEIKGVEDLKGKKVRVQGTSQGDFVTAVGGSPVTIPFAEVLPGLQKGVVDCGITGSMPGYKAKWHEVVDTVFRLPVGYTLGFWAVNLKTWQKLTPAEQTFLKTQFKALEDRSWKMIAAESDEGIACNTGGTCSAGPAAKAKLVNPSEADIKAREKALNAVVLANWAKRCTPDCVAKWNELVGKKFGLKAGN
ncbi:MAG: TRAP transporter substrate-binding protein [Bradyrhizobium sp.]|uniref:TRAP transporter substrate-binding protein n=1 Tax=Bradyrhizobium sp. TaxID=376 RepID=UPI003545568A